MKKEYLYVLLAELAIMAVGYYLWFSPLVILMSLIALVATIVALIYTFVKRNDNSENIGCVVVFAFGAMLVTSFLMKGEYKVSVFGGDRHLYVDCPNMESNSVEEVGKFSAIIWGCTNDCPACKARRNKDMEIQQREAKRQKRNKDLRFIEKQISELEEVRQSIISGEEVNVEGYEFRYKVEDDIRESAIEEYNDAYYEPRRR